MAKFRKKPVVIDAHQWGQVAKANDWGWPDWLKEAMEKNASEPGAMFLDLDGEQKIKTLEGNHTVSDDDWIIRGIKGELYSCKPDIFQATYEEVVDRGNGVPFKAGVANA